MTVPFIHPLCPSCTSPSMCKDGGCWSKRNRPVEGFPLCSFCPAPAECKAANFCADKRANPPVPSKDKERAISTLQFASCGTCDSPNVCRVEGCIKISRVLASEQAVVPPVPTGYVPPTPKKDANGTPRPSTTQNPDPIGLARCTSPGLEHADSGDARDKPGADAPRSGDNLGRVHEIVDIKSTGPYNQGEGRFYHLVVSYKIPEAQYVGALVRLLGYPPVV